MKKLLAIGLTSFALSAMTAFAAAPAADDASDAAYGGGWTTGSNGGTGFGAWTLSAGTADTGHFIGDSSLNGSGTSGDINTSGASFGMFSKTSNVSDGVRPFTGALSVGDTFSIAMDNGYENGTSDMGFALRASGATEFEFKFKSGDSNYQLTDSVSAFDTGVGFTDGGLVLSFTLTSATTYDLGITPNGSSTTTLTGRTLAAGGAIDDVRIWTFNTGAGNTDENGYVNSLSITNAVPEPGTLALLGTGLLAIALRRRMRHA